MDAKRLTDGLLGPRKTGATVQSTSLQTQTPKVHTAGKFKKEAGEAAAEAFHTPEGHPFASTVAELLLPADSPTLKKDTDTVTITNENGINIQLSDISGNTITLQIRIEGVDQTLTLQGSLEDIQKHTIKSEPFSSAKYKTQIQEIIRHESVVYLIKGASSRLWKYKHAQIFLRDIVEARGKDREGTPSPPNVGGAAHSNPDALDVGPFGLLSEASREETHSPPNAGDAAPTNPEALDVGPIGLLSEASRKETPSPPNAGGAAPTNPEALSMAPVAFLSEADATKRSRACSMWFPLS